ncbi:MAG: M56 family metallopeptidase [Steroidobacteraceae bacterium]
MSFAATLCLVLLAAYGLASLLLSIAVAGLHRAWPARTRATSGDLLTLRLLPSAGALFLTMAVVLPAFLSREPNRAAEPVGPLLAGLAVFALLVIGAGLLRGWRAWVAAAALLRSCGPANRRCVMAGLKVDIVDVAEPMVAVIGAWRPRIVAAKRVLAACSREEFRQVIGHEAAHMAARDNLKLLLLLACPDALAWMPAGGALTARWRAAAELEADALATGADRCKRVALASALLKVARLSAGAQRELAMLMMSVALDDVEGRVRRLLGPSAAATRTFRMRILISSALPAAVAVMPLYGFVQELVEALVAFGR